MELAKIISGVVFVAALLCVVGTEARSRRNPPCNDDQQKEMNQEFQACLSKFTKEHHESSGKATTAAEFQKFTCKLLSDTVECGNLWKRCHSPNEVRSLQDMHIQARISQFRDNTDGIDVFKCPVVAEYINSGRADRVDQSTEGACTVSEVSDVQRDFQECSHNKSLKLYEDIQRLQEGRFSRDTNDLTAELIREDREATLDPILDIRPKLCSALAAISKECIDTFNKCFSKEDRQQIKRQHIEQMQKYYARIYEGVGNLTDCPHVKEDPDEQDPEMNEEQQVEEDYNEVDPTVDEAYDEDYYYPEAANRQATTTTSRPLLKTAEETRAVLEPSSSTFPDEADPEGNAVIAEAASRAAVGEERLLLVVFLASLSTLLCRL